MKRFLIKLLLFIPAKQRRLNGSENVGFQKNAQTETDRIVTALKNDTAALNIYRRAALETVLKRASNEGFLNGQSLWTYTYGKNGVGDAVMEKTFGKEHAAELKRMIEVGRRMNVSTLPQNAGNPQQTGRSLINWFEQAMVINIPANLAKNILTGNVGKGLSEAVGDVTGAGTYVLTIRQISNLLNSPEGTRLLTKGLTMDKDFTKTAAGVKFVTQLLSIAGGHVAEAVRQPTPPTQPSNVIQPPTGLPQAFQPQP